MNELIQMVAGGLGTSESSAKTATAGMLRMIKSRAGKADFSELLGKLPGADSLLAQEPEEKKPGAGAGGLMGGMLGSAASAVGGNVGSAAGLLGVLGSAGIDPSKAGSFAGIFLGYIKGKAGNDLLQKVLSSVPDLKKLAG